MQSFENYSKTRLLISITFGVVLFYFVFQILVNYINYNPKSAIQFSICNPCKSVFQIYKEHLQICLLLAGMILFTLNKKITDFITFAIFIFLLGWSPVEFVNAGCLFSEYFSNCLKSFVLISLFLSLPLAFLTINFIKNIGKE
jgi:hypothetical protein